MRKILFIILLFPALVFADPNEVIANQVIMINHFDQLNFLVHVCALSLSFLCGFYLWYLIVYGKNNRNWW